jgi:diguanylate cyclase (GGDEF)-like protein
MRSSRSPSAEAHPSHAANGHGGGDDVMRRRFVEAARRAEIVALVNAASSEAELGLRFCEELCEVFEAEVAFVVESGGEQGDPRSVAAVGMKDTCANPLFERSECRRALEYGRAASLDGEDILGLGAQAGIVAPFRSNDGRSALVGVARLYPDAFDESDRALIEAVTLAAGQALERIWGYDARNRAAVQQTALVRAAKSMSRSLEISEVLQTLCEEVALGLGCDKISAHLGDEVDGYAAVGAIGMHDSFIGFRQSPGSGLGGEAVRAGRVMTTQNYQAEGFAPPEAPILGDVRSAVSAPIRWDGRVRGFFSAGFTDDRKITSSDVELVEGFAELAGLACANAERHANLRVEAELDGLTGCINRDALQRRLEELVVAADRSDAPLTLALVDLDGFKSINDIFGHPSGDAVLQKVGAALRQTIRAEDVVGRYGGDEFAIVLPGASEKQASPLLDRTRAAIRSLEVPGGELTACVGLAERAPGESLADLISRADDALREAKHGPGPGSIRRASRVGPSIAPHGSPLNDSVRRHRWRATAGDIALDLSRQPDSESSATIAARELIEVLKLRACTVLRLDAGGVLDRLAGSGDEHDELDADAERGTVGRALREKRAILGAEPAERPDSDPPEGDRRGRGSSGTSEIAVPILIGGRVWGALRCIEGSIELDDVDVELASAVGEHLSSAIRADDLYDQLTKSMIGTAEALAAALEAKDSYTADHARSIAELAVEVGAEMGLPDSAIDDLRYGGIFHDVGKIAIPDAIINKPGPLTDEEFEVIKTHPVVGAEILAPVPFLYGVRTIVRHAHEHWDGGGYPDGLRGAQIPLGARIVLAVDAYHAMTSDRPYRKHMSHEDACDELRAHSGTQFDPEVVDSLLVVLERRVAAEGGLPSEPPAA